MLIMREDQLTLGIANEQGLVDWFVTEFMPENLSEEDYDKFDEETRRRRVKHGRDIAIRYGFNDPVTQTQFVALMWRFGTPFFLYPGVKKINLSQKLSGTKRIDPYYERSDDEFTDVVIGNHDSDWFIEPDNIPGHHQNQFKDNKE